MLDHKKISIRTLFSCYLVIVIASTVFSSCILNGVNRITNTPGFYSGYRTLSDEQRSKIIVLNDQDSIPTLVDSNTYAITAKHLMTMLKQNGPSIVYFWSPFCKGKSCIPIPLFQNFCTKNGYKSIIVAQYFEYEMLYAQGVIPANVFAINNARYGTDYANRYTQRFQTSLFKMFGTDHNSKTVYAYLYYDGRILSCQKPSSLKLNPWMN